MSTVSEAKNVGRASTAGNKITVRSVLIYAVLILWTLISIFPVYWMLTFSLKTTEEIFGQNVVGLPQHWVWENYTRAMNTGHMEVYFLNSFIVAVITILITLVASAMATYAMTRLVWKGRGAMNKFFMLGLTIPIHAAIVPLYVVLGKTGLLNSHAALIIPYSAFSLAMGILICTGFMGDIPYDLDEAAFLDGCGVWGIFLRVIAPLMVPAISTVGIYTFLQCWNELMFATVFNSKEAFKTLPVGVQGLAGQYSTEWGPIGAALAIATIPTLLVYVFLSKRIQDSFIAGAVKG
jgi:raffinose/stachyose/melibiose transport system permease protein